MNSSENWSQYCALKKECHKQCRSAYQQYINSLADPHSGQTTKRLWSFIENKRNDQCGILPLQIDDTTISDSPSKAEAFNKYFASVFSHEVSSSVPTLNESPFPELASITISVEDVAYHLSTLQTNKATGPDKIPVYFLKRTAPSIVPILATVFQLSLQQGILSPDWKTANIIPIHKKGSRSQTSNYRPVSLTELGKLLYKSNILHITSYFYKKVIYYSYILLYFVIL